MSVEQHTFLQILFLPSEHILELIETVGAASVLSAPLGVDQDYKIAAAFVMMAYANTMLEQCGCEIDTKIANDKWTQPATYQTEVNDMESMP